MNQNLSNGDEELVDILTYLEQSGSLFDGDVNVVVNDLLLKNTGNSKFARQGPGQANDSNLSENQSVNKYHNPGIALQKVVV